MAKAWRLTPRARASFADIVDWTQETFGNRQAASYGETLIAACSAIAAGEAHVRDCGVLLRVESAADYRFARAGEHFVIFRDSETAVSIVDFLHARSDLVNALVRLIETESRG